MSMYETGHINEEKTDKGLEGWIILGTKHESEWSGKRGDSSVVQGAMKVGVAYNFCISRVDWDVDVREIMN